jgi:hypothetical protein
MCTHRHVQRIQCAPKSEVGRGNEVHEDAQAVGIVFWQPRPLISVAP